MKRSIMLGGGCFWGLQKYLRDVLGVSSTSVGYSGGGTKFPSYKDICSGTTGHAEIVLVNYDGSIETLDRILSVFFRSHDPTTLNKQKNDVGTQYRSVIYVDSPEQADAATKAIDEFHKFGGFDRPAVTEVSLAKTFYAAEEEHQDYLKKNPFGYNCHFLRSEYKK